MAAINKNSRVNSNFAKAFLSHDAQTSSQGKIYRDNMAVRSKMVKATQGKGVISEALEKKILVRGITGTAMPHLNAGQKKRFASILEETGKAGIEAKESPNAAFKHFNVMVEKSKKPSVPTDVILRQRRAAERVSSRTKDFHATPSSVSQSSTKRTGSVFQLEREKRKAEAATTASAGSISEVVRLRREAAAAAAKHDAEQSSSDSTLMQSEAPAVLPSDPADDNQPTAEDSPLEVL